ncbi:MAG: HAD family hydrolase [Lachnospiraceae bacterium]|nr:HAD family hydrolase [Lachnospiraceae bacterium]
MIHKQVHNLILDVDGTLWNTTDVVAEAWNEAITADGRSQVHATAERLQQLFGKPMNVIGELLFTDVSQEVCEKLLEDCCQYEQRALCQVKADLLYPGVADTMEKLVLEQGRRLYVVSNCQRGYIELFLEKNDLENYVTDLECYGNTGKGKGENIRLLMDRNGISQTDTVYVGDTAGDQQASAEAGVDFIHASYGFGTVEGAAGEILTFSELLQLP